MKRRRLIPGLVAWALVAVALAGGSCTPSGGGSGDSIRVAVVWTGSELQRFREVVDAFEDETDTSVQVLPVGDDIDAFVQARLREGNLPDIAIVSKPGLVTEYAERDLLRPLDGLAERYDPFWTDLVDGGGHMYGAFVKAAHSSLIWHRRSVLPVRERPMTWPGLVRLVDRLADDGSPAPLAIGAADGWLVTQWAENLLAAYTTTEEYQALAGGVDGWCSDGVASALEDLAELWSVRGAFPGGGERALLTQFDESVIDVASTGEAVLAFGPDFAEGVASDFLPDDGSADFTKFVFPFPTGRTEQVLGGDAAVVFRDSELGSDLVDWLTEPTSFRSWALAGGYFSPVEDSGGNYRPEDFRNSTLDRRVSAFLAGALRQPDARRTRFDLTDQMTEGLRSEVEAVMQDFFGAVTASSSPAGRDRAVDDAASRLNEAAGGRGCGE
jgi:ABC-type glycerol-3-phosphate transport system substrate-binding protein